MMISARDPRGERDDPDEDGAQCDQGEEREPHPRGTGEAGDTGAALLPLRAVRTGRSQLGALAGGRSRGRAHDRTALTLPAAR